MFCETPQTADLASLRFVPLQMTARVLESLEHKDSTTFAAACESLWGKELPPPSCSGEDPTLSREVRAPAVTLAEAFIYSSYVSQFVLCLTMTKDYVLCWFAPYWWVIHFPNLTLTFPCELVTLLI